MCDIAPFFMACAWEDVQNDLISCNVHHLACAGQELCRSLPIVGEWFNPYVCPDFRLKEE